MRLNTAVAHDSPKLVIEIALLLLLSFLWGGSFTLIKVAVETIPPATIVATRVTIAAFLLFLVVWARGLVVPTSRKIWLAFLVQGCLQNALPFTLISWGEIFIDSGLAGILNATPPVFVLMITLLFFRQEKTNFLRVIGVVLGIVGVVLVIGPDALSGFGDQFLGQVAILGASLCYAFAAIFGRRFSGIPHAVSAACTMLCASVIMVPISLLVDDPWKLTPSRDSLGAMAVLSVFSTAVAAIIYFRLLRTIGSIGTSSGSYLRAGFSVLLGVAFLDEVVTWPMLAGLLLIASGVKAINSQVDKTLTWLWLERMHKRRALSLLDESQLSDIGLTKAEVDMEVRKPFWRE